MAIENTTFLRHVQQALAERRHVWDEGCLSHGEFIQELAVAQLWLSRTISEVSEIVQDAEHRMSQLWYIPDNAVVDDSVLY